MVLAPTDINAGMITTLADTAPLYQRSTGGPLHFKMGKESSKVLTGVTTHNNNN